MKKFILTLSLLLGATTSLFSAGMLQQMLGEFRQHIPEGGSIHFEDRQNQLGIVKDIILNDANFQEERNAVNSFITQHNLGNTTYQNIVTQIRFSDACLPDGLEVLEAFERAIMYYIHKQNYITTIENKWLNIFVTGIRWPSQWLTDSPILQQCMRELSTLAQITEKYSTISSTRMKLTIESYRHWRKNMLIAMGTYLVANGIFRRDFKKSPLGILMHGGLMASPKVITQFKDDVVDFTTTVGSYIKPVTNRIINGLEISNQATESSSEENLYTRLKKGLMKYTKESLKYNHNIYNDLNIPNPDIDNDILAEMQRTKELKNSPKKVDISVQTDNQSIKKYDFFKPIIIDENGNPNLFDRYERINTPPYYKLKH